MAQTRTPDPSAPEPSPRPVERPTRPPLPVAEVKRRRRETIIGILLVGMIITLITLPSLSGATSALGDSALFLFLNAVTVMLIVVLVFFITRNFWKILAERRRGILGSHLNLKFVAAFVLIAFLPTTGLLAVSSYFIASSIDSWFGLRMERALEESRDVADIAYTAEGDNAIHFGALIAEQITAANMLREDDLSALEDFVMRKQREYNLGVVEVFSTTGRELVVAVNPEIPDSSFSRPESEFVRSALEGTSATRVEPGDSGDLVRGAVPIRSGFHDGKTLGAVVVSRFVPVPLAGKIATIHETLADYRQLLPKAGHIRAAYLLELLLAFFVVLLLATWMGFRLARGVTTPIRALAEGTAEVARGNLDVVVEPTSDDEVGFLVASFNRMTRDIKEARQGLEASNAELDQRRSYMELVLRNVGAGVVSVDGEGRIGTINPSAQRLLGVPPGVGVVGRKLEEVITRPEHLEVVQELQAQLVPGMRESLRRQVQLPVADEVATLLVTMTLLQDEEGGRVGIVMVFDDYSQVVKVQRMEAWREVARRIAHEIKNPLTPIQLSAQRLRRRFRGRVADDPADMKVFDECVGAITGQVETLKRLVDEFSNFARLPAAHPRPHDLNALVAECVASYQGTQGVRFATALDPALPRVELDAEQTRRVLTNLIDNAIAACGERRAAAGDEPVRIEVRTVHDEPLETVRVEVGDQGVGIRQEDRRRIFEPYFSTKTHGTGLGLAIVSRIVADHRGYIRVHDNKPQGSRFIVELPVRGA
jgi:two-component system nitrogen regulation sensor histidine kinase NtrY